MRPIDESKSTIPDDFPVLVKLPTQDEDVISAVDLKAEVTGTKTLLLTNIFMSFIINNSLRLIFGSILSLQILAHLPLANINLPANAMGSFEIMIEIVSFDYFPFFEIIDMGFSPTEPWSTSFDLLNYETINFLEGMGSIQIFIWLGCLYILIVYVIYRLQKKINCCSRSKITTKYFKPL